MTLTKAVITCAEDDGRVEAMFNPTQLTITTKAVMDTESGKVAFKRFTEDTFSTTLFFDTFETGANVRLIFAQLELWQRPTMDVGNRRVPPQCTFTYGTIQYRGVISNLSVKYTMFLQDGTPVRADVSITFQVVYGWAERIANSGRDNCRRLVTVRQNDRLDLMAADQTGSATNWRVIAAANDVEDPTEFPNIDQIGRTFVIPDLVGDS